jgi:DNA polymerase III subunit alpha
MGDTAKVSVLIQEARSMGVEVLPPDVNESRVFFAPARRPAASSGSVTRRRAALPHAASKGASGANSDTSNSTNAPQSDTVIRFGLAAIKGVGQVAVESILKARDEGGRFSSLADLCERVDTRTVNRKMLEALIKCGACDGIGENRATLFARIDPVLARATSVAQDRQRGQASLFGMLAQEESPQPEQFQALPEWPESEMLAAERELLGFYVTGHPLTPWLPLLEKFGITDSSSIMQVPSRAMTRIGGMITTVQQGISKKSNKPYAMVTVEDLTGSFQVLCMNENYDKFRDLFVANTPVLVVGEVNNDEDRAKIFPQEIMLLESAPAKYTRQVHLRLQTASITTKDLEAARELVSAHRGKVPLFLCLIRPGGELAFIETNERYSVAPSIELQRATDQLLGENTYYAKVDSTLPERALKKWERKGGNGDD